MNIVIFNDKFSDNLGDGILSECLEKLMSDALPDCNVVTLDIDGKEDFREDHSCSNHASITGHLKQIIKQNLPRIVKDKLIFLSKTKSILGKLKNLDKDKTVFMIGGGHLISGTSSYFPIRIHAICSVAKKFNIPVFIQSVGVSPVDTWTEQGKQHLMKALNMGVIVNVAVRDEESLSMWNDINSSAPKASLSYDPAILASYVYQSSLQPNSGPKRIGLNVMNKNIVQEIGQNKAIESENIYVSLVEKMLDQNYDVVFFTNGDFKDQILLNKIKGMMAHNTKCVFLDRPATPTELVTIISQFDAMLGFRMHSCITAYSLKIPHIGVQWDIKLKSFFDIVKRSDDLIAYSQLSDQILLEKMAGIMDGKIDDAHHGILQKSVLASIQETAEKIKAYA